MLKNCPDPIDIQDIHFKLHCRLKAFENKELQNFATPHSLIACASRYGLIFLGTNSTNLQAIQTSILENYTPKDKDIYDYPYRNVTLPSTPKHISVNCDHTIIAVVIEQDKCPVAVFYDVLSFYKENVQSLTTVRLSANPGTYVTEINWNPAIPAFFTACKSDGSLGIYELKGVSVEINEIPPAAEVSSFCWSPKGKQIAVGSKKGTITQYKPDLKAVRMINAPPLDTPSSLISLQWISNYQFIGVYQLAEGGGQAKLIVVDAPKVGEVVYTNYDDVCYSGSSRKPQFFLILQQQWNILMVASANSAELAVLGLTTPDSWTQWIISDSSRAELPLSIDRQETLPIGLSIDISNTKPYPWGESTIPPCPYVMMLSHQGVLCIFDLVNLKNVPSICTPADRIQDQSGFKEFHSKPINLVPSQRKETQAPSLLQPASTEIQKPIQLSFQVKPPASTVLQSNPTNSLFSPLQGTPIATQAKNLFNITPTTQQQPTLFGDNQPQAQTLFSGQASLTPIKPPSVSKPVLDQISITPISKNQQASNKGIGEDKYSSIFSALNAPQQSAALPVQVKPIVISTPTNKILPENIVAAPSPTAEISAIPKPEAMVGAKPENTVKSNQETFISKPIIASVPKPEVSVVSKPAPELAKVDTEAILKKMIKEDCLSLESELRNLTQKTKMINVNLGSESDKIEMLSIIQNLEEFLQEISEISVGEHSEIHSLKQNLVLSWAWYEEALSRYNTSKDDMMKLLIKSQPLDSATEKRYNDIKQQIYYIESQLLQVSKSLDEQWDKFQDYVKKTYKVQMPTMETIYQTMVRQNAILQKQDYILKDISSQLKKKHRTSGGSLLLSVENVHLEDELQQLQLSYQDNKFQLYEKAVAQSKRLSSNKSKKLQHLLKNRDVVHIRTIKSYAPSETFQSPNKRLSLLGAKMSPVPKLLEPKQIDFSQSTPFHSVNLGRISSNSTQVEMQPIKPLNFGKPDIPFSNASNRLIPLTKSTPSFSFAPTTSAQILSSNLPSAFVPTTQAAFATKENKTWSFSVPSSTAQKSATTMVSESKPNTQTHFMFSSSAESHKPVSSIPTFGSTKTGLTSFSFATTTARSEVTSGSSLFTTPTKTTETPTLFGNTIPKSITTASSNIPKTSKPTKTSTISASLSTLTTTNLTSSKSSTGFSTSAQTVTLTTRATNLPESDSIVPSAPVSSTFSFATKTQTPVSVASSASTQESKNFNLTSNTTTTSTLSIFGSITSPISTATAVTSQTILPSSSFSFGTTTFPTIVTASATSVPSSTVKSSSTENSSVTNSVTATSPLSSLVTTKTTSSVIFPSVTTSSMSIASSSTIVAPNALFGTATPSGGSIFGATTTTGSIFGSSTGSAIFATSVTTASSSTPLFGSNPTSTGSLFGVSSTPSTTSSSPLFGANNSAQPAPSIFGTTASTTTAAGPSIFGSTGTSIFGSNTTVTSNTSTKPASPSVFGSSPSTPSFGASSTVPASTSIFGNVSQAESSTSSSQSIFGSTAPAQSSIFGQPSVASTTSIFGGSSTTTSIFGSIPTTTTSIFGSAPTTSIFGNTPTTTQISVFGSTTTSSTQGSLFGSPATQGSIFGSAATTVTTQPSIFGATVATSIAKPIFGSSTSSSSVFPATTVTNSPFGQSTTNSFGGFGGTSTSSPLSSTSPSVFGQQSPSTFGSNTGSIFGGAQTTTTGSIFGANTSGSSTFGAVSSSGSIFGAPTVSSSFSFASTPGTSGESAINFGDLNVGSATTAAGSIFGGGAGGSIFGAATAAAANPFGKTPEKSAFGGGSNLFASPATTASVFGSNTSFGATNQSTFGSTTFGSPGYGQQQPAFGQSTFGSGSTGSFGNAQRGPFSSGGAGVGQSGFGSPTGFQKPASGFGSAPVFGGSPTPAFGGSPSFGGAPAFGAAPAFGSPTKVFGSNTPTAAFGSSSAAGSPGFGNLANQSTIGFGNLAKQASNFPSTPFSGNSSFSSWR